VAVWVFLLIPTWVRRSDLHWRRGPIGTAVVAVGPTGKSSGKAGRVSRRRLLRRSHDDLSIEVEAMAEQDAQFPAEAPVVAASAPRARVAAAPSSGRLGTSVRNTFGTGPKGSERKKPPLRVRRARRLVVLAALALGTLIAAIASGGLLIAVNVVFDVILLAYVRHLRNAARTLAARAAREKRARAARIAWDEASAQERASALDGWSPAAPLPATEPYATTDVSYIEEGEYAVEGEYAGAAVAYAEDEIAYDQETAPETTEIDLNGLEQPALIDLTDAPTEELIAAQAS
jgi:hypothetical protein